jgi:oxygen-independent coproporphyrinogen-3 oxidase
MLPAAPELKDRGIDAVRFATPDSLDEYSSAASKSSSRAQQLLASRTLIDPQAALEESFFLGLRLNRGLSFDDLQRQFGEAMLDGYRPIIAELAQAGLLESAADRLRLTPRGRLLSNEVFGRFLKPATRDTTPT